MNTNKPNKQYNNYFAIIIIDIVLVLDIDIPMCANIVKRLDQYNENHLFFCEPIKNNIMSEGNFLRILYSNHLFVLNGVHVMFTIYSSCIEKCYNKIKFAFHPDQNAHTIERLQFIEESILSQCPIQNKTPQYKITDQLKNNYLKIFFDSTQTMNNNANTFLLKISGVWETATHYGVTYKFTKVNYPSVI